MNIPFDKEHELEVVGGPSSKENSNALNLPGYPRRTFQGDFAVYKFLRDELCSVDLDKITPYLWWMSNQNSASISPLHRQQVKNRTIIISEEPKLHLIWHYDRIFVKPLPKYLLSYDFWDRFLTGKENQALDAQATHVREAALGFLRTYFHLIKYESDFRIAQDDKLQLLPVGVTWEQFCAFSERFDEISDQEVSLRYHYGEIRLSRLNFYGKFLLRRAQYHRVNLQYRDFFLWFYGPLLAICAIMSLILSAMQVGTAVQALDTEEQGRPFFEASFRFSVASIVIVLAAVVIIWTMVVGKIVKEWVFAIRCRLKTRKREMKSNLES
jgi:hypothetical protein